MVKKYEVITASFENIDGEWVRLEDYAKLVTFVKRALTILANDIDIHMAVARSEDELRKALSEAGKEA